VSPATGRAASGGALSPETPPRRATRSQPEPMRTVEKNIFFHKFSGSASPFSKIKNRMNLTEWKKTFWVCVKGANRIHLTLGYNFVCVKGANQVHLTLGYDLENDFDA